MSPQKEDGYTPIANELFEAFYRCKLTEYERCVVMCIWRKTYGWSKKVDWVSNSQLEEETGIALPNITRTLNQLKEKKIIIKNGRLVGVNKKYKEWVVEWRKVISPDKLVISPDNQKLSHQIPTKERKEIKQKITSKQGLQIATMSNENLIPEVIKLFEVVDPKNKTYYGNKTQRGACQFLLDEYGFEQIKQTVEILEQTNQIPFFPTVTTPVQLRDKWVQLQNAIQRKKNELKSNKVKII